MLALVVTLVLALYILGPELFSRLIVAQFAPARVRSKKRGEEITRAVALSSLPLAFVWLINHFVFHRLSNYVVLRNFMFGLYSEQSLKDHFDQFFPAAITIIRVNFLYLLLPVYGIALAYSLGLVFLIRTYGRRLRKNEKNPKLRAIITWLVRPWLADWHLKLSRDLLPKKSDFIQVDVLTKMDILFRGTLVEHQLGADGELVTITLRTPLKFKRKELLDARAKAAASVVIDTGEFWTKINAEVFIVMASEIVTLNLNYVDPSAFMRVRIATSDAEAILNSLRSNGGEQESATTGG